MARNPSHRVYERRWRDTCRQMKAAEAAARLFVGVYPCGIVYSDRGREEHGDYKRLAFHAYADSSLAIERDCPLPLERLIRKDAETRQPGTRVQISSCGQSVVMGSPKA